MKNIFVKLKEWIESIYYSWLARRHEKDMTDYEEQYKFIWGIKAYDDLTPGRQANHWTMNDADIVYDTESKEYRISIETIYHFTDKENGEKKYLQEILDRLTDWMIDNNYDINQKPFLYGVFTEGYNIKTGFKTIEELYTYFKMFVKGYCAI